ncbi:MAG: MBL fold metallo-hydrolase [Patescibacteria group bacterium]
MYITWFGQSCFKLQGKEATIITDPFDKKVGLTLPRLTADIVTVSHDHYDHSNVKAVSGEPFVIKTIGEYEINTVSIRGIPSWHDAEEGKKLGANIIFIFQLEEIRIAHLGDLGTLLTDSQLEHLGNVDILMIPVGGTFTLSGKQAAEVVSQVEPRIAIPMHYKIPKLTEKLDTVAAFCSELGVQPNGEEEKFKVTKKELPAEETKVIILKP